MVGAIVGGLISALGGLYLISIKAASQHSIFERLATGIGIYALGKGVFMISTGVQSRMLSKQLEKAVSKEAVEAAKEVEEGEPSVST